MKTITLKQLKELISNNMEDTTEPNVVRDWCVKNYGKRLTSRNVPTGYRISQLGAVLTYVESETARFLIANYTRNVIIPTPTQFELLNPSCFEGATARNAKRRALLTDPARLKQIVNAVNGLVTAIEACHEALGDPLKLPDYYKVLESAGIRQEVLL